MSPTSLAGGNKYDVINSWCDLQYLPSAAKPSEPVDPNLLCPRQERQETAASYVSPQSSIDVDAIMTGNAPSRQEVEKQKQQLRNEAKGK